MSSVLVQLCITGILQPWNQRLSEKDRIPVLGKQGTENNFINIRVVLGPPKNTHWKQYNICTAPNIITSFTFNHVKQLSVVQF